MANNLSDFWQSNSNSPVRLFCIDQPVYAKHFDAHFAGFTGKILEIGAGNGFLAKHIIKNYDVEYSILDREKSILEFQNSYLTLPMYQGIKYYNCMSPSEFSDSLSHEYDLLIECQCLSETPEHYWQTVYKEVNAKSCFIIDEAFGHRHEKSTLDFNGDTLRFVKDTYPSFIAEKIFDVPGYDKEAANRQGLKQPKGIMMYIGKSK